MSLVIILLSYFIGCISTIGILICLYIRYGLYPSGPIFEQESFQTFHPLSENDQSKNSTIDTVNYLFQFLFQELKDTSKIRRYVVKKLTEEFEDIKKTQIGKLLVQNISIRSFSMGKECPTFHDIQLERQERDERKLIKKVVAKLILDYKDGFSITLDLKLLFGYTCQLFIKVKRIQGHARLEFRREPFSHWLVVFQDDPKIDFDIKAYLSSRESKQLAHIINQQIRRIIRRKQTWPSYKIRYKPFFPLTNQSLSTDIPSFNENQFIVPSKFYISIKSCDRFSIPFDVIQKNAYPLFISIDINEQICEDYLRINRNHWIKKSFHFRPKSHQIDIKEINYMNRREFLIEHFNPIPNEIDDKEGFKIALENRNIFLMQIRDKQVKTLKQINSLIHGDSEQIQVVIGMPLLHTVQVRRTVEFLNTIRQQTIEELEQSTDSEQQDLDSIKTSMDKITLVMINNDLIPKVQAKRHSRDAEYPEFDNREYKFQVGSNERFLNICLWCEPRLDFDVSNLDKKCVLLGYTSAVLSEIIFDAQMSLNRETQMTLNFRSIYSDNRNDSESKLAELSRHKGYDDNMTHGFVTINIRYEPDNDMQRNQERTSSFESINEKDEEHEIPLLKPTDHLFEDQHFTEGTSCAYCQKKIWLKTGRQCRDCLITVHKKCDVKFNQEHICLHEPFVHTKSTLAEDERSLLSIDDVDSENVKRDSLKRRSFRRFRKKNVDQTSDSRSLEVSKNDESDHSVEKRQTTSNPSQRSSKIVSAASSAYSKFREFKTKRSSLIESKKPRSLQDLAPYEDISENDLQDIITRCLSDENTDMQSLEDLFREKAIDNTAVYAKANEIGAELYGDLTPEERKQKLDYEIYRLQQEIDLQNRIRDEMIIECNNNLTDENAKRNIQAKLDNIDEKIQALRALTLFYCSGLKYCRSEIESKGDSFKRNSKALDDSI